MSIISIGSEPREHFEAMIASKHPHSGAPMDYIGVDGGVTDDEKEFTYSRHQGLSHCGFKRSLLIFGKKFLCLRSFAWVCGE